MGGDYKGRRMIWRGGEINGITMHDVKFTKIDKKGFLSLKKIIHIQLTNIYK